MAVASAGPYANNLHLAPDRQPHVHHHSIFTGRMLFMMTNQQRQSIEGIVQCGIKQHQHSALQNMPHDASVIHVTFSA